MQAKYEAVLKRTKFEDGQIRSPQHFLEKAEKERTVHACLFTFIFYRIVTNNKPCSTGSGGREQSSYYTKGSPFHEHVVRAHTSIDNGQAMQVNQRFRNTNSNVEPFGPIQVMLTTLLDII